MVDRAGDVHVGWSGGGACRRADVERRRHEGGRLHGGLELVAGADAPTGRYAHHPGAGGSHLQGRDVRCGGSGPHDQEHEGTCTVSRLLHGERRPGDHGQRTGVLPGWRLPVAKGPLVSARRRLRAVSGHGVGEGVCRGLLNAPGRLRDADERRLRDRQRRVHQIRARRAAEGRAVCECGPRSLRRLGGGEPARGNRRPPCGHVDGDDYGGCGRHEPHARLHGDGRGAARQEARGL